jgi:hypothetical protein
MAHGGYIAVAFDPNKNEYSIFNSDRNNDAIRDDVKTFSMRGEALCAAHDRRGGEVGDVPLKKEVKAGAFNILSVVQSVIDEIKPSLTDPSLDEYGRGYYNGQFYILVQLRDTINNHVAKPQTGANK